MDTMDIPPLMDTMVDIIHKLTDMDTDTLERDLLMPNLNPNTTIIDTTTVDTTIMDTTIGDTMVDSLDTTIIEMFKKIPHLKYLQDQITRSLSIWLRFPSFYKEK